MKNKNLINVYEKVYKGDRAEFFTFNSAQTTEEILKLDLCVNKKVLEIGCGYGETAWGISEYGNAKEILAIDFSQEAIRKAKEKFSNVNLTYECKSYEEIKDKFDVIITEGTIEHMDDPFETIGYLKTLLNNGGKMIHTCPSFLNIRGYVWMSLSILFEVPMSLTDLHFICPFDMEDWAKKLDMKIEWHTIDEDVGNGKRLIIDMEKRLTNALRDAGLDNSRVPKLIEWLNKAIQYDNKGMHSGAMGVYILSMK